VGPARSPRGFESRSPVTKMRKTTPRQRSASQGASFAPQGKLRKRWRARIWVDGRRVSLGYFATKEEARAAHEDAVKRYGLRLKGLHDPQM
jgi:hypothetical protein